jgi:hypothetical protein
MLTSISKINDARVIEAAARITSSSRCIVQIQDHRCMIQCCVGEETKYI